MIAEAPLEQTASGLEPAAGGWFAVNVRDTAWETHQTFGSSCVFESERAPFAELGINLNVLRPGQPLCLYHRENAQEDFLILAGECLLIVEGEERSLGVWDFVHCPPETEHVFIGTGEAPCVVLATGARRQPERLLYPVTEAARRHGAAAATETASAEEAYAPYRGQKQPVRPDGWDRLPWA